MNNSCTFNGLSSVADGAGIHATGNRNRIEGNNVIDNDCGIDVDIAPNLIISNSASRNFTDFDFVAGNTFGSIQDFGAGGSISTNIVLGNGVDLPNAWSNFSY